MGANANESPRAIAERRRESIFVAVFALIVAVAYVWARFVPNTWIVADCRFFLNVNTTLVEDGTLDQHRFASSWYNGQLGWNRNLDEGWSNVALGQHGEYWPKHPIVISVLSTPLYLAFGVFGTLVFNVLVFVVLAGASYFVVRGHASAAASGVTVLFFVMGSGVTNQLYNYNGDVLLTALLACSLVAIELRRGGLAGVLFALGIMIKPTAVLLGPLLLVSAKRARVPRRIYLTTLLGGGVVLLGYAALNTWMFGSPWTLSYERTLVVVNGEQQLVSHASAFNVAFEDGARRTMSYLRDGFAPLLVALVGAPVLLVRRPLYFLATLVASLATFYVFSLYRFEGDRFLFPGLLAVLVPASLGLDALSSLILLPSKTTTRILNAPALVAALASQLTLLLPLLVRREAAALWENDAMAFARCLAIGTSVYFAARLLREHRMGALAPVAAFAIVVMPGAHSAWREGGGELFTAALVLAALCTWREKRWLWFGLLAPCALYLLFNLRGEHSVTVIDWLSPRDVRGDARVFFWYAVLSATSLFVAWRVRGAKAAWFALGALSFVPGLVWQVAPTLLALFTFAIPLSLLSIWLVPRVDVFFASARSLRNVVVVVALLLSVFGLVRNARAKSAAFRFESDYSVMHAEVHQGNIPCDFLAWEHMSWECASVDHGLRSMVGLGVSDPPRVNDVPVRMLLVPANGARVRSVRFAQVRMSDALNIRYATPDRASGDGEVEIFAGDERIAHFTVRAADSRAMHTLRVDTRSLRERTLPLEIRVRAQHGAAEVLFSGGVN